MSAETTPHEDKIDRCVSLLERLNIKLFGEVDGEHPTGRLPVLEGIAHNLEKRVQSLETWKSNWLAIIAFVLAIATVVEAFRR